jgi:hypothetical protein
MTRAAAGIAATAQQVAVRAWEWLDAGIEHFALPAEVSPAQLDVAEVIKPLGELALAGSLVTREGAAGHRQAQIASALVEFAWAQLRGGEVLYEAQRAKPVATYPMETYAPFVRAGYRHRALDDLLGHLTSLRAARELLPNRALAVFNAARVLGLPTRADPTELAARTWLGGMPEPWAVDFVTLYAMTHTVFHLTDWGAYPSGLPDHLQAYLQSWLPAWVEVYLEAGQWDLVAELLIVDLCLTDPEFYPHAWDGLVGAQHSNGLLPYGPMRVSHTLTKAFRNHYHPTLVAAIAGTLAVSRRIAQATPAASTTP